MMFTLRDIPHDIHRRWKYCAAYRSETMRKVALDALLSYIAEIEAEITEKGGFLDEPGEEHVPE